MALKKSQTIKDTKIKLNSKSKKTSNRRSGKSGFSILFEQGYAYKKMSHFGKLTKEQVLILIAKWKKLLPDLNGTQKDIALETIRYLQSKKFIP